MSKIDEIKEALAAATPGPWSLEEGWADSPMMVMRPGGNIPVAELSFENYENDGNLIAKAPEYIAYLLKEREKWKKLADAMNLKIYGMATKNLFESPEVGQEGEGNQDE